MTASFCHPLAEAMSRALRARLVAARSVLSAAKPGEKDILSAIQVRAVLNQFNTEKFSKEDVADLVPFIQDVDFSDGDQKMVLDKMYALAQTEPKITGRRDMQDFTALLEFFLKFFGKRCKQILPMRIRSRR